MREQRLGEAALFLLPSLKMKQHSAEERVHRFLMETFGGYTAAAGNIFGYWVDSGGGQSYGEHRQFLVALDAPEKRDKLTEFLASIARELDEESILLQTGNAVSLVWAQK